MGLESATNLDDLDETWPTGNDPVNKGDDHIRLLKAVLKIIFPGTGGDGFAIPITATEAELNFLVGVTSLVQDQIDADGVAIALRVLKAGDTLTGQLKGITPVADEDLSRKDYVDTEVAVAQATADLAKPELDFLLTGTRLDISNVRTS